MGPLMYICKNASGQEASEGNTISRYTLTSLSINMCYCPLGMGLENSSRVAGKNDRSSKAREYTKNRYRSLIPRGSSRKKWDL